MLIAEARNETGEAIRGLRIDGSPKLHAEILASELESIPGGDVQEAVAEAMPGATLVHGALNLPAKLFVFLWGIFLCFGPTWRQARRALAIIFWVVSDCGTESSIAASRDCLPEFYEWIGDPASANDCRVARDIDGGPNRLLPNSIFIPGCRRAGAGRGAGR